MWQRSQVSRGASLALLSGLLRIATGEPNALHLPLVDFEDLTTRKAEAHMAVHEALSSLGGLVVTGDSLWEGRTGAPALQAWAACLRRQSSRALRRSLAGGAVSRTSFMSQFHLTDEAASGADDDCELGGSSSDVRRSVRRAVSAVLDALDSGRKSQSDSMVRLRGGQEMGLRESMQDLDEPQHLEHIHLYEELPSQADRVVEYEALNLHTDAGFLLAFIPPLSPDGSAASYLRLLDAQGKVRPLAMPPANSVVLLMGQASSALRQKSISLRPVPHALIMPKGFGWRAWYGVMLLMPADMLLESEEDGTTFGNVWSSARKHLLGEQRTDEEEHGEKAAGIACGGRKLQDQAGACPNGTISCWMSCMSTAGLENCNGATWLPTGTGDLATLSELVIACRDRLTGKRWPDQTGQMCDSCAPMCTVSATGGSSPTPTGSPSQSSISFCVPMSGFRGPTGTTMYMDGFTWTLFSPSQTCLSFLLPSLVLDTMGKFLGGCIAVVAISATVELSSLLRRFLPVKRQQDVGLLCHAFSLALAYTVMLFVMTYSLEFFFACILGLIVGHVVTVYLAARLESAKAPYIRAAAEIRGGSQSLVAAHATPCCRLAIGQDAGPPGATEEVVTLSITGMTCSACTSTVRRALEAVEGVLDVVVSFNCRSARVTFILPATQDALKAAVEDVGFSAAPLGYAGLPEQEAVGIGLGSSFRSART